jgi:hypothetical protein
MAALPSIAERLRRLDWKQIAASLWEIGYARADRLLTAAECTALVALYPQDERFRSRVHMERHRFGVGDYAYFAHPLPGIVRELRTHGYRHLAPIANAWADALGETSRFPPTMKPFLARCHAAGQTRPTPLLLRYAAGGYNRLHRDLYGELVFPLQLTCCLSRPGTDYAGGDFLLVEQLPRMQLRGDVVPVAQGDLIIFPVASRPVQGRRGYLRAGMRHGVGRITRGSRYALGVIFHDAR